MKGPDSKAKRSQKLREGLIEKLLFGSAILSVFTTLGILGLFVFEAFDFFGEVSIVEFLTGTLWTPLFEPKHFGVLPLVYFLFKTYPRLKRVEIKDGESVWKRLGLEL